MATYQKKTPRIYFTRPLGERFLARVTKSENPDGCWEYKSKTPGTYGTIWTGRGLTRATHFSILLFRNERVPPGKLVMHTCDNPPCVNPKHLIVATPKQNSEDAAIKGRLRTGPRAGGISPKPKLTIEMARVIRRRRERGEKVVALAREYGVTTKAISDVIHFRTWTKETSQSVRPGKLNRYDRRSAYWRRVHEELQRRTDHR